MVLVVLSGIAFTLEEFFLCRPTRFFWDKTIQGGKCADLRFGYLVPGIVNMVVDVIIFG